MKISYKIWLEDTEKAFGKGPYNILKEVERTGSLRQAALYLNMSYSKAYQTIKNCENQLNFKLIDTQVGGKEGGGSHLTQKGSDLNAIFESFMMQSDMAMKALYDDYFADFFKETNHVS